MPVYELEKITYSRIKELDRKKTMIVASMSPIEVHGPHLPLGEDLMTAQAIAESAVDGFIKKHPEWTVLLYPPIPVAADGVPKLGSVTYPASVVKAVAYHSMAPFAKMGFSRLAFSSFHGGPRHFLAIEAACEKLSNPDHDVAALSLFSAAVARLTEGSAIYDAVKNDPGFDLSPEQIREDHHGAFMETSLALHLWPDLVEKGYENLPPSTSRRVQTDDRTNDSYLYGYENRPSVVEKIRRGAAVFRAVLNSLRHYQESTYHGHPAGATAKRGELIFNKLTDISLEIVEEFAEKGNSMDMHSPLWKMRHLALNRPFNFALDNWFNPLRDD